MIVSSFNNMVMYFSNHRSLFSLKAFAYSPGQYHAKPLLIQDLPLSVLQFKTEIEERCR